MNRVKEFVLNLMFENNPILSMGIILFAIPIAVCKVLYIYIFYAWFILFARLGRREAQILYAKRAERILAYKHAVTRAYRKKLEKALKEDKKCEK